MRLVRHLQNMNRCPHPPKKIKLENDFDDWNQREEEEDVWSQTEMTADEFDLLELQATQKFESDRLHKPDVLPGPSKTNANDFKNQQFALEGQVKFLSDSLSKTVQELDNERTSREQIITEKIVSYKENEQKFKVEIEKAQTSLQFKEQEVKAAHSKIQLLEQKLKDFKSPVPSHSQVPKNSNTFLNRFQFDNKNDVAMKESSMQTSDHQKSANNPLKLLSAEGECKPGDITSNFLANRRNCSIASSSIPFFTFAQMNLRHSSDELWQHYATLLKKHTSFLKKLSQLASGKSMQVLKRCKFPQPENGQSLSQFQSTLGAEMDHQHSSIVCCLKDLRYFFAVSKSQRCTASVQEQNEQILKWLQVSELSSCSAPLFNDEEKVVLTSEPLMCLQSLIQLANPDSYPECYSNKIVEMQLTLSVLIEWSQRMSATLSLEPVIYAVPLHTLASGTHGRKLAHLTVQLLLTFISMKSFPTRLIHYNGKCIIASIADLCHTISSSPKNEFVQIISTISRFLCGVFAVHGTPILNNDTCPCSTQLVQGFIVMMCRYHELCTKTKYSTFETKVLTQAVLVLHQLCIKMQNFREKRFPVEDQYIVLVSALSKLTKGNSAFKSLQEIIHDLWDFQDEGSDEQEEN